MMSYQETCQQNTKQLILPRGPGSPGGPILPGGPWTPSLPKWKRKEKSYDLRTAFLKRLSGIFTVFSVLTMMPISSIDSGNTVEPYAQKMTFNIHYGTVCGQINMDFLRANCFRKREVFYTKPGVETTIFTSGSF